MASFARTWTRMTHVGLPSLFSIKTKLGVTVVIFSFKFSQFASLDEADGLKYVSAVLVRSDLHNVSWSYQEFLMS